HSPAYGLPVRANRTGPAPGKCAPFVIAAKVPRTPRFEGISTGNLRRHRLVEPHQTYPYPVDAGSPAPTDSRQAQTTCPIGSEWPQPHHPVVPAVRRTSAALLSAVPAMLLLGRLLAAAARIYIASDQKRPTRGVVRLRGVATDRKVDRIRPATARWRDRQRLVPAQRPVFRLRRPPLFVLCLSDRTLRASRETRGRRDP